AGGVAGERDVLRPLPAGWLSGAAERGAHDEAGMFTRIDNEAQLDRHFARAAAAGKFVLLDYYADWCVDCKRMEKTTFRDPRVAALLRAHFIALQIDVTDPRNAAGKALKKRFGVFGPPAALLFGRDGAELRQKHFYGYRSPDDFHALISALTSL
ncbi:MAG: thioredoxin family protein, partial [Gammaproteobacteria bacterium]